ncbi:MAG TPA: beta-ketoacyl synthase N-terminal-like domain-containing protein [Thermoanaerobaculia bacterium]
MSRVAVTGIGVVAPGAIGVEAFRELLASGRSAIEVVDRFDVEGLRGRHAALVRGFNARDFIAPMKMRRMNALSRLGVAAAKMAFDDASPVDPATTGVAIGTAFGPVQTSVDYMREYVEKGASLSPPQLFAESVANAAGSHIAIEWGLRGFNVTVTQRESSALAAAMYGASQVVKGTVTTAVIGGVEEVNEMIFSVLDRLGALGNESHPFDRRRDGLVPGEGSAVLVAQGEVQEAYGYLAGFGIARDTTASISDWGEDHHAVVTAMRGAIDDAELTMRDVDAIYASASSTRRADRVEYRAIEELFGEAAPPVVATKGYFGEYAAGGALQLVAALLAIDEQTLHASCGFEEGDAEMRIDVVRERRPAALRNVLVNSISAGGGIVSAVVSREAA